MVRKLKELGVEMRKRWHARVPEQSARRATSRTRMAPTSPRHTRLTTSRKPLRRSAERPEMPRSASITSIFDAGQPSCAASSTSAYWRARDSGLSRTWAGDDWRTYTIAVRSKCVARILLGALMGGLQRREEHVGQWRHQLGRGAHGTSVE